MPLDEVWHELSGLYPGVFPEDTNSGDMPRALADIVARLRSSDGTYIGYDEIMARQSFIRDVYDSYWNVSTLYTVADVKQKEINALKSRHAQRMSDLRTKHREKVEQLHLEQKAAVEAVRAAERQRSQERTRKALDKHRENQKQVAANQAERREKTEVRRKIRKAVMELDKLLNRGDKKKNVKDGMSEMVSKSLKLAEALFMDEYTNRDMLRNGVGIQMTDAEEKLFREAQQLMESIESGAVIEGMEFDSEIDAMEQMKKLDSKLSGKMAKLKDVFARERKRLYGTTVSDLLGKLADEYSRLSEAEDGAVRAAKDENVYAHLLQLQKDVGGTTVRDMTLNQMEAVADAFTMVLTTVRNANKMFAKNLKFKRDTLAAMVMGEIGAAAKKRGILLKPGQDPKDKFLWNNLKPVYAFERLGSQTLKTMFGNIRKGQDVWAVDMQEADVFRREQYRKHDRKNWDMEKQYSFEFESGKVDLSLEQIMSLYAYSRRETALDHLMKGGFVFGDNKTQVYDSVLSRSANMRSKSGLMNMVTSFMAEPTTSINMLEDALRSGDRQQLKRTAGAVYGSVLLNSLLVSLVYAARDDDEDETWWEKYLSSVAVEMVDGINPITYYPFLRDVWSIGQGFDVERADMSLISDFADAAKNVVSAGMKLRNAEEGEEAAAMEKFKDSLWSMTDTVASLTGLPVKNIRRDIDGARNLVKTIGTDLAGRKTTDLSLQDAVLADVMNSIPIGGLLYSKNKRDRLYGALVADDAAYVQRLKASYDSEDSYHTAIKQALRDYDSRIWEAAVAWNAGDMETYIRIAKDIRSENRFEQDDIVLAIRAEASSMQEKESSSSDKVYGYFTNEKFGVAMGQNNVSMADTIRKDLIDTAVANGKTREEAEESVRSTARTQLKQLYANGTITGANAEKMLVKYGGYDQKDAAGKVAEWKYEKDFPELDGRITYTQYKRWEADGKTRGISLDTFTEVTEYRDSGTSGSVRSQDDVKRYIESITGNKSTRHALWCCFYKESTSPYK